MFTKTGLMSKGLMQGIWKTKFLVADEGLDYAETYKDGLLNGLFTVYSANRTIHYQTVIENGTGVWKSFYSNGKLELTGMYKNGREHGTWVRYTRTGQTEEQLVFEHGIVLRTVSPPAK